MPIRTDASGIVSGVNDTIFILTLANHEVIVGRKFTEFGESTNASGLARWGGVTGDVAMKNKEE